MAYNSNIPQPNDQISTSQPDLLANFQEIATALAVNHGPFNGLTEGMHLFLQMPVQAVVPAMSDVQIGMVSQTSAYSGVPELSVIRPNSTTTVEFTSALAATTGWTRLPSGILLKWGTTGSVTNTGIYSYAYPEAATIPVFANVFQTFLTGRSIGSVSNVNVLVGGYNTGGFNFYVSGTSISGSTVGYLTIGN